MPLNPPIYRLPKHRLRSSCGAVGALLLFSLLPLVAASMAIADDAPIKLNVDRYNRACGIKITQQESRIQVSWPLDSRRRGRMTFELAQDRPLIQSIDVAGRTDSPFHLIAEGLDPVLWLRVGKRDLAKRSGWIVFFDRMQQKPNQLFQAKIVPARAIASSHAGRATLTIGELAAGPFRGEWRWTFYAGNPFVLQEAALRTESRDAAYLYDAGYECRNTPPSQMAWRDASGPRKTLAVSTVDQANHLGLGVRGRTIAADFQGGSLAIFPPPHRYFYPLDFSNNLRNIWMGPNYGRQPTPFGFGVRHDPRGDDRFVPWFNAPPGAVQEMGLFLLISDTTAEDSLQEVARLTRDDRFAPLPGHTVFSSHYHVEHTRELLEAQRTNPPSNTASSISGRFPAGGRYAIPARLIEPGFVRVFRRQGVDIVHLAEFHFGGTPSMKTAERLRHLELLHAECQRLSKDKFLLLPGEEPNVHLGGHWISLFPKPVYWVLNRAEGEPFATDHPQLGRVYHVGGEADVERLLKTEGGLAWTAHPRIKGSTGFPDRYRDRLFFQSDRFLGAAWKAMPADLSQPRLGGRGLDLLDDMSNWGNPKYVLGEVDVFKIEPDHELYGHMNVNYLRLDKIPRFQEGWQPVLDALRGGRFFVTTGEILIPGFTVERRQSGEALNLTPGKTAQIELKLEWTFPLVYAQIVSGDGRDVKRQSVDLSKTGSFGKETFTIEADLAGQRWVRVEVWDIATNGAFTQPVWLNQR